MKLEFILLVAILPVLLIGLVCWLTITGALSGATMIIAWVVAVLASVSFDSWVSARYTMKRLAKQDRQKGSDHHD